MKSRLLLVSAMAVALGAGCVHRQPDNVAFQNSTIPALMEGVYDGDLSLERVRKQGDFGLGTLDGLDGELVLLDGVFYQVTSSGYVARPTLKAHTPLAVVCFFKPQQKITLDKPAVYAELRGALDRLRPSANVPYAIRITGQFDSVQTRSVPRQRRPYRRLAEVTKGQPTFELSKTEGTLVGFWFPSYMKGLNVPGYHLHYLTADRSQGGHVLDCRPTKVTVEIAELSQVQLRLPLTPDFLQMNLESLREEELQRVEQAPSGAATQPKQGLR